MTKSTPLIAPFIYLLALAAVGKHSRGFSQATTDLRPEQQLTITLVTNYDIAYFFSNTHETTAAFYDKENGIFVSFKEDDIETLEVFYYLIFHEAAHFVAYEVMKNFGKPYQKKNDKMKQDYLSVLENTKEKISNLDKKLTTESQPKNDICIDFLILERLRQVFTSYQKSQHEAELFVIVAETIALLGYEKGYEWLLKYVPDLVTFYETQFNPACITYLEKQCVWDHIEIDPAFSSVLGLSNAKDSMRYEETSSYQGLFANDNDNSEYTRTACQPDHSFTPSFSS
jgi:hypothetical protein